MKDNLYDKTYEQIEFLGKNVQDNSKMYLVKDLKDKKYKTAKKIEIWTSTDNSEDQILTEVSFLKTLNHPHILKYYDICLENDELISILQFCEQGDMDNYLQNRQRKKQNISQKLIICWLMQLLMGLEYIHGKNIIHRLVCSRNIYMNHQGDLKLGAFGFAKVLENTMKKAMSVVTEPCNMSPQMVNGQPYDSKADIWALGCLVYEMATFKPLFKFGNLAELYDCIVQKPSPDLPTKYMKYLNPLFKKMMKKSPNLRPSASELLQEEVFIKLMKQYIKKKKIDSLDLKYIVPKHLNVHRKALDKKEKVKLPSLLPNFNKNASLNDKKGEASKRQKNRHELAPIKSKSAKLQSSDNESDSPRSSEQIPQRITTADLEEGNHISKICQSRLEIILKKYKPNMSQIYEQTTEFDDL